MQEFVNRGSQQIGCFLIDHLWFDIKGLTPLWFDYRNAIIGGDEIIYEDYNEKCHTIEDNRPPINAISRTAGTNIPIFFFMGVPVYLLPFEGAHMYQKPTAIVVPSFQSSVTR